MFCLIGHLLIGQNSKLNDLYGYILDTNNAPLERMNKTYSFILEIQNEPDDLWVYAGHGLKSDSVQIVNAKLGNVYTKAFKNAAQAYYSKDSVNLYRYRKTSFDFVQSAIETNRKDAIPFLFDLIMIELFQARENNIRTISTDELYSFVKSNITDRQALAGCEYSMAYWLSIKAIHGEAMEAASKALNYYEQQEEYWTIRGDLFSVLATSYSSLGRYEKSELFYNKALNQFKLNQDSSKFSYTYMKLMYNQLNQGKQNVALIYIDSAIAVNKKRGAEVAMAENLVAKSSIYMGLDSIDLALETLKESHNLIIEKSKSITWKAYVCYRLGIANLLLGHYEEALKNGKEGLKYAEGYPKESKENYYLIYLAYQKLGNLKEEYKAYKKFIAFKTKISNTKNADIAARLELESQFAKERYADSLQVAKMAMQRELEYNNSLNIEKQQRNLAIGIGCLVLVLAAGVYSRLRYTRKSKAILEKEKERSENLLLNILPEEIAQELKEKGRADARDFDQVSILFTDFKGFTEQSEKLSAAALVKEINTCFEAFDGIMEKYGIEKIKTIGDAYMAAGGLPVPTDESVKNTVLAALEMQEFIDARHKTKEARNEPAFEMRVGIHTGPVVAGIVGVKKFQYDIWGDTVNTASRMESAGEVGKVNVSQSVYDLLKDDEQFTFESRGKVKAKGKGEMEMHFVSRSFSEE
jgi:class 3 adenylate cyclase